MPNSPVNPEKPKLLGRDSAANDSTGAKPRLSSDTNINNYDQALRQVKQEKYDEIKKNWLELKLKPTDIFKPIKLMQKILHKVLFPTAKLAPADPIQARISSFPLRDIRENMLKEGIPIEENFIWTEDGIPLRTWFAQNSNPEAKTKLYFHGNAGDIATFSEMAKKDYRDGYNVCLTSYRGYSGNPGFPSKNGLTQDAKAVIDYLIDDKLLPSSSIDIEAHSLGCAVAIEGFGLRNEEKNGGYIKIYKNMIDDMVATNTKPDPNKYTMEGIVDALNEQYGKITLNAPLISVQKIVLDKLKIIPNRIVKEITKTNNLNFSKLIALPTKLLHIRHGKKDKLIPIKHSEDIYDVAKATGSPAFLEIQDNNKHNDILNTPKAEITNLISPIAKKVGMLHVSNWHGNNNPMEHALDISNLEIGDEVVAVEDSTVKEIVDKNPDKGPGEFNPSLDEIPNTNYIILETKNGELDIYAHTKQNSSSNQLKVGDQIKQGTKIAEIGNNGATTCIHLHFQRSINNPHVKSIYDHQTIPIKFDH